MFDYERGLIVEETLTKEYQTTAKWVSFANLVTPWSLGFENREIQVASFDPEEVLREAPDDVIAFVFFRRLVADIEVDGETLHVQSNMIIDPVKWYFINIDKIHTREEVSRWWANGWLRSMTFEMDRRSSDYAVAWPLKRSGGGGQLGYDPEVDVLLTR